MKTETAAYARVYQGLALIADPIYQYDSFTVPMDDVSPETTEKELIDSPWMQRLRRIYQLQSARWVYPAAEHTRFQHSLGTMHVAGEFARHLYPSLKDTCKDVPSSNYVEELLRLAGLLHDVGHGPFGHFFDEHYLGRWGLTHEDIGRRIIVRGPYNASLWVRPEGEPLWKAFEGKHVGIPLIGEPQGEGICFDGKGLGYFTLSEKANPPLYYFAPSVPKPD
mgnify:CR=1 FL=1